MSKITCVVSTIFLGPGWRRWWPQPWDGKVSFGVWVYCGQHPRGKISMETTTIDTAAVAESPTIECAVCKSTGKLWDQPVVHEVTSCSLGWCKMCEYFPEYEYTIQVARVRNYANVFFNLSDLFYFNLFYEFRK